MKELSIEEKAKAYDEAIEKAKSKIKDDKDHVLYEDDIIDLFPELKIEESEDERIRKWCISHFKECINVVKDNDEYKEYLNNKVIPWLEKKEEHSNFLSKIQIGDKVTRNEDGVLVNLSQLNRIAKKDEKQGEQKHQYISRPRYIGEEELLGEQKSVKVPKFKVGDFIQFNGMGHTRYTVKEVCGLSHYINTCNKRMDMSYTDANFELVEQKPNGWSEEDENHVKSILSTIECCKAQFPNAQAVVEAYNADIEWFKSLKDRIQPQPNQEWNEKDEQLYNDLSDTYFYNDEDYPEETYKLMLKRVLDWMTKRAKFLRPQSTWKPSDEQIFALQGTLPVIKGCGTYQQSLLESLYEDLKKLKE